MGRYFLQVLKLNIKTKLEYKASFIINLISQLAVFFAHYYAIIALFTKFDNIAGYTKYEVLLCFSIIAFGFAFNETFFRGIDRFEHLIIDGSFDRVLLRPRNVLFQVMFNEIDLVKIMRIIQALIIMVISLAKLNIEWSMFKLICLILMVIASCLIFFGIFVATASYCFITVQGLEIKNLFTDGGKQLAQYPISIYHKSIKYIFTFIIPYAFINYYPLMYFLGRTNNILYMLSPIVVFIFLIPCLALFNLGLKHYSSTGS